MTQIDAAPLAQGKPATAALRDRGHRGPGEGEAETTGDKPRFGDHWRDMLSGGETKGELAAAPDDTDGAEGKGRPPRFEALLRLPTDAFARQPDGRGDVSALSIDAAQPGEKIDITDVLDALKNAGRAGMGDVAGTVAEANNAQPEAGTDENELALAAELLAAGNGHANGNAGEANANAASAAHAVPARDSANAAALPAAPPSAPPNTQPGRAPAQTAPNRDLHLATRAEAAQPALKATVVHQATHFAPALGATNVQAISGAISEAAGDLREGMTRSAPAPAAQQSTFRPGDPVKTLTIQLTPISLGKVTVEMRIVGGAMKVDIQVADPKALEMVRADKDLIMSLVRKTGVVPDTVTIQPADNASSAKQNQNGQGGAGGSGFDREASRDGAGRSGRDGQGDTENGGLSHDERTTGDTHLRGDIYL